MYAETGAAMRVELAGLLRQHRIQQRLGGATPQARQDLGRLIREYRQSVLMWMNQAMRAAAPVAFSNIAPPQPNPFRAVGTPGSQQTTFGDLARALDHTTTGSHARIASSEALSSPHPHPMVDGWGAGPHAPPRSPSTTPPAATRPR